MTTQEYINKTKKMIPLMLNDILKDVWFWLDFYKKEIDIQNLTQSQIKKYYQGKKESVFEQFKNSDSYELMVWVSDYRKTEIRSDNRETNRTAIQLIIDGNPPNENQLGQTKIGSLYGGGINFLESGNQRNLRQFVFNVKLLHEINRLIKDDKPIELPTFKKLFKDPDNAQHVKDILKTHGYVNLIDGKYIWKGLTKYKTELLSAYNVLMPILNDQVCKKVTTGARIFYNEFGKEVGTGKYITDRGLRYGVSNDSMKEFERIFAKILPKE